MSWVTVEVRAWYQNKALWIGCGVALCLAVLALPHAAGLYHRWSGQRHVRRAEEASGRGDLKQAILEGRVALALDPRNVEALRVIAKSLETAGAPGALEYRRQLDAIKPGDSENVLGMAEDCVKTDDLAAADATLAALPAAGRETARYHSIAAGMALKRGEEAAAENHLAEAVRIDPKEDQYRITLDALRLNSRMPETRTLALQDLQELGAKSPKRLSALRVLLEDAKTHRDPAQAYRLAETLAADPQATFADRLNRLATLRAVKTTEFGSFSAIEARQQFYQLLGQMQTEATGRPVELFELMTWMNEHDLALSVIEWAEGKLSAETVTRPPAALAVADAYARTASWARLQAKFEKAAWQQSDFLRLAYLARAQERLGESAKSSASWTQAVAAAQANTGALERLAWAAERWDWPQRMDDLCRKLAEKENCPRWVIDRLWSTGLQKGDSAQLFTASKLILRAEPRSIPARNRYINLCLLTGQDAKSAPALAEALYRENPTDLNAAVTYGLSLYRQGRPDEAVAVVSKFGSEALRTPRVALYYGIYLAAAGQAEQANEYLELGAKAPQLPEEKALGDYLRLACQARFQGGEEAWNQALEAAHDRGEALEALGKLALQWGWTARVKQVVLKLAAQDRCPLWAVATLWAAALESGDSAQIYRAAQLIQKQDPRNEDARANFVLLAVLGRHEAEGPDRLAETLHKDHPANLEGLAAYGLALTQQGRPEDAVALMKGLSPERLREPRASLYYGIFLAAAGQTEKAGEYLQAGAAGRRFPDEAAMVELLNSAAQARVAHQAGDEAAAAAAWARAMAVGKTRLDWIELLGRMALNWGWSQQAEQTLWALAETEHCPRWALDFLWQAAEREGNSANLYRAGKMLAAADPKSLKARNNFIFLSLLTGQEKDSPERLAEGLHGEYPVDADVSLTYALSLYRRGHAAEAAAALARLKPDAAKEPRVALYYGLFLAAAGETARAEPFLQAGAGAARLPEEKALLAAAKTPPPIGAAR